MALTSHPSCEIDPEVRQVRPDELDAYLVAAVDMFIGEVGVDPRLGDGGRGYRRRVASLIAAGRAWARFEHGQVVFKAEVGSQSPAVGQIQGVWVHPEWRGRGLGTAGHRDAGRRDRRYRPHRQPVRQRLQHRRPGRLRPHRLHPGRHVRDRPARLSQPGARRDGTPNFVGEFLAGLVSPWRLRWRPNAISSNISLNGNS